MTDSFEITLEFEGDFEFIANFTEEEVVLVFLPQHSTYIAFAIVLPPVPPSSISSHVWSRSEIILHFTYETAARIFTLSLSLTVRR